MPSEEGDDTEEAKQILDEPLAAPAPIPVMQGAPIVDSNPLNLQPKVKKGKKEKKHKKSHKESSEE